MKLQERDVNIKAESETPFYTPEKIEISETNEMETENEIVTDRPARGQQDAVSTIPAEGTGAVGFFGVGSGGRSGAFGWRGGGGRRRRAMNPGGGRSGGSPETEKAVDKGLEWLKFHQEPDGRWDLAKYEGTRSHAGDRGDMGISGLALLAFLGAGHTSRHGIYKDNVQRAVKWLISKQNNKGCWDSPFWKSRQYQNGIATMALSEAAGMGRVKATLQAAQRAVDGLQREQISYGAFDYWNPKEGGGGDGGGSVVKGQNDTSITIWCAMAYKSAKVSGLKVRGTSFSGILNWIDVAQDLSDAKPGDYEYEGGRVAYRGKLDKTAWFPHYTPLLTAAGGVIRLFWGQSPNHPGVVGPCNLLLKNHQMVQGEGIPFYMGYYATLLMFQKGGEHWKQWNASMKQALLQAQRKGDPREMGGSWDVPRLPRERTGGRVFTTSLGVLMLEVYYRYLPMYRE